MEISGALCGVSFFLVFCPQIPDTSPSLGCLYVRSCLAISCLVLWTGNCLPTESREDLGMRFQCSPPFRNDILVLCVVQQVKIVTSYIFSDFQSEGKAISMISSQLGFKVPYFVLNFLLMINYFENLLFNLSIGYLYVLFYELPIKLFPFYPLVSLPFKY